MVGRAGEKFDVGFLGVVLVGEDAGDATGGAVNAAEHADGGGGDVVFGVGDLAGFLVGVVEAGGGEGEVGGVGVGGVIGGDCGGRQSGALGMWVGGNSPMFTRSGMKLTGMDVPPGEARGKSRTYQSFIHELATVRLLTSTSLCVTCRFVLEVVMFLKS